MARHSGRKWAVGAFIGVILTLMCGSLLGGSRWLVLIRTAASAATIMMLAMIHRANRAQTRATLKQLDDITRLISPRGDRSTVDDASRRVH